MEVPLVVTGGGSKFNVKTNGFKPSWIVIHHSHSADNMTRNWGAIRAYHMSYRHNGETITADEYAQLKASGATGLEMPWRDIGYHFGVENVDGTLTVMSGRAIGETGAHAIGFNEKSIGICLIGNYDLEPPSEDRLFIMANLCRNLQLEFAIPRDQVIGHYETYLKRGAPVQKTCPGSKFNMDGFRQLLRS